MRKWDVLAVGANSVDFVYRLPAPPQIHGPRAKMRIGRHLVSCGGQATTMLATIAAMGLGRYVGVTGNDDSGERMRRELTLLGLDIEDDIVRDVPNPHAVILVDESSGERMVLWDREDGSRCGPTSIRSSLVGRRAVVHVDDTDQAAGDRWRGAARRWCAGHQRHRSPDRLTEELIAAVSLPMFAEHVPAALTGEVRSGAGPSKDSTAHAECCA